MNPMRVYFTGEDEFTLLVNVLFAARAYQKLLPSEQAADLNLTPKQVAESIRFVNQKVAEAFTEWKNQSKERRHNATPEEELRYFGNLTLQTAKKAQEDIAAGRAAQARAKRAKDRGDIEERGHFR
jgi:hypothetical protein